MTLAITTAAGRARTALLCAVATALVALAPGLVAGASGVLVEGSASVAIGLATAVIAALVVTAAAGLASRTPTVPPPAARRGRPATPALVPAAPHHPLQPRAPGVV